MSRRWPLLVHTLSEARRALAGWTAALLGLVGLYTSFYPQFRDHPDLAASIAALPTWARDTFNLHDLSGAGWLGATVYGGVAPIVIAAFAITFASRVLSGDEESRVLELYLSCPLSRTAVLAQKLGALAVALIAMSALVTLVVGGFDLALAMDVPAARLAAVAVHLMLLGCSFGALTAAAAGFSGRRSTVAGTAAAVAAATYVADGLGKHFASVSALRLGSPFYWYLGHEPIRYGSSWGDPAILLAASLALFVLAAWAFERRDVGV